MVLAEGECVVGGGGESVASNEQERWQCWLNSVRRVWRIKAASSVMTAWAAPSCHVTGRVVQFPRFP